MTVKAIITTYINYRVNAIVIRTKVAKEIKKKIYLAFKNNKSADNITAATLTAITIALFAAGITIMT